MRSAFLLAFFIALAGRVLALNIAMGGALGNITADQFLEISDSTLNSDCQSRCDPAKQAISGCNGDDTCLCGNATIAPITDCQQCWFTDLIEKNIKAPDPRAGQTAALSAYSTACQNSTANVTVPATSIALTLPDTWDGPQSNPLNLGETVVAVIAGGILSGGALFILTTM